MQTPSFQLDFSGIVQGIAPELKLSVIHVQHFLESYSLDLYREERSHLLQAAGFVWKSHC